MSDEQLSGRELDAAKSCARCGGRRTRQNHKYCSKECYHEATWQKTTCQKCGREFEARRIYLARGQMKFCSTVCSSAATVKRHHEIHAGVAYYQNTGGYMADSNGRLLHRVVWESKYGPIPDGYLIHHKDYNKRNNALRNLELMEWGEHTREHNSKGVPRWDVVCRRCGVTVSRRLSDIKRGQNKYCSNRCANLSRTRKETGVYA